MLVYVENPNNNINKQIFKIVEITNDNQISEMITISFGGNFFNGEEYFIYPLDIPVNPAITYAKLNVNRINIFLDTDKVNLPSPELYYVYVPEIIDVYLPYVIEDTNIVIPFSSVLWELINTEYIFYHVGFVSITRNVIALNVPNFSFPQNFPCYKVKLNCLILPNNIVKGYSQLLSFFPYVIVKLYNVYTPMSCRYGSIITNNNTSMSAQFICPIGNLLNPNIIRFVEVHCPMEQIIKIDLYHDLFFEILLPNGKLLEFDKDLLSGDLLTSTYSVISDINEIVTAYLDFSIRNTVAGIFTFTLQN
jgi:hypothetical protein